MKTYTFLSLLLWTFLGSCSAKRTSIADSYNQEASLSDTMTFNPLEWKVICSSVNKNDKTMSTLYGNDVAVTSARAGAAYPAGTVIALVSWSQKEDRHWYGGQIPGNVSSIERISFNGTDVAVAQRSGRNATAQGNAGKDSVQPVYEKYEGKPLQKKVPGDALAVSSRIGYLVSQKASVMP